MELKQRKKSLILEQNPNYRTLEEKNHIVKRKLRVSVSAENKNYQQSKNISVNYRETSLNSKDDEKSAIVKVSYLKSNI